MSYRGISWAWDQQIEGMAQRVVLLALGQMHGHDDDLCFPALETLTRMAGTNKRRLIKILADLEKAGLIRIDRGGGRRSNHYILIGLNDDLAVPPVAPQDGPRSGAPGGTTSHDVAVPPVAPQSDASDGRSGAPGVTAAVSKMARSGAPGVTRKGAKGISPEAVARPGAREAAADSSLSAAEYLPVDAVRSEALASRPEMRDHIDDMLERLRGYYAPDDRKPRSTWDEIFRRWFRRHDTTRQSATPVEAPHPVTAKEAQRLRRQPRPEDAVDCSTCGGGLDGCHACDFHGWVAPPEPRARHGPMQIRLVDDDHTSREERSA